MANTFLTPQMVANEALALVKSNMVARSLVHNDYSKEFAKVGETVNVRKPAVFLAKNFTGTTTSQTLTEVTVPVKLDRHKDITVAVTSKELSLDIKNFGAQVLSPMMLGIAEAVDADILASAVQFANNSVSATASPTDLSDIASLGKYLDVNKAPQTERYLVFGPEHKYRYAITDQLSKVSYAGDNQTLRNALLGRLYNFDTLMDQNSPDTQAATAGTASAYKIAGTKGETVVALSAMSAATATIKEGDGFIYAGRIYRFTEDGTGADSAIAEINIDQPLHATTAALSVYVVDDSNSIAFQKNAIAFVTRPLELPLEQGKAALAFDPDTGLSVRIVFDYNSSTKTQTISADVLYGIAELNGDFIARLSD